MVFRLRPGLLVLLIVYTFVSNTLCWLLRTKAIQNIDVTVVSIAMPLSSLITMVVSVLMGTDVLSLHFVLGAVIILLAAALSGVGDMLSQKNASSGT